MSNISKKKLRNDIVLVIVILSIAIIGFLIFVLNMEEGKYVKISLDNKELYVYNLNENRMQKITSQYGDNVIEIKDGKVTVNEADCPDKICVKHSAISKTGQTIVCLPHRLVVEITDEG